MNGVFKDGAYYPLGAGGETSEGEYQYQLGLCEDAGRELDNVERQPLATRAGFWRVRGGAILKIREMTDAHLENAINYAVCRGSGRHPKIDELRAELERRRT